MLGGICGEVPPPKAFPHPRGSHGRPWPSSSIPSALRGELCDRCTDEAPRRPVRRSRAALGRFAAIPRAGSLPGTQSVLNKYLRGPQLPCRHHGASVPASEADPNHGPSKPALQELGGIPGPPGRRADSLHQCLLNTYYVPGTVLGTPQARERPPRFISRTPPSSGGGGGKRESRGVRSRRRGLCHCGVCDILKRLQLTGKKTTQF